MSLKSTAGWLVVLLVISPFLIYGMSQFIPGLGGFVVESGSMEPEIQTGSILFTYRTTAENINVGDTITYQSGESFVTHQVIEKNSSNNDYIFRTQGVANQSPDPGSVNENQIAGKKLFSIPYTGYIIVAAGTQTGKIVLILVPAVLIISNEALTIFREVRENKD